MPSEPDSVDIFIKKSDDLHIPSPNLKTDLNIYSGTNNRISLHRPQIIYVELINGRYIKYKTLCNMDNLNLSIFILNIPIGYLLFQANNFVLHASALEINDQGILFCGFSKSGKSTTLDHMLNYGKMISEDVCLLQQKDKSIYVCNSFPGIKIDLDYKNFNLSEDKSLIGNRSRIFQKVDSKKFSKKEITKVKKIIILGWDDNVSIKILKGGNIFKSIFPHLFRIPLNNEGKKIYQDPVSEMRQLEFFSNFSEVDIVKYQRPNTDKVTFLKNLKEYVLK